jgi:hypothetical protein
MHQCNTEAEPLLVRHWKSEGVYPFAGPAGHDGEAALRGVFDLCALGVHEHLDTLRQGNARDKRFILRMLRATLEDHPESLQRILVEILGIPADKASVLSGLLLFTSLPSIIEASKVVTDRLRFLAGLQELLFQVPSKQSVKERGELHRILASEPWIFGEEFALTGSNENLNTVLRKHMGRLASGKQGRLKAVLRDDGSEGVVDLVLGREATASPRLAHEFLVVELKRPTEKIDLRAKAQIESYAMAVASDDRFDTARTHWTFLAVSNEMTPDAARSLRHPTGAFGCFHEEPALRIGLATWGGILSAARARLEFFRSLLNVSATPSDGIAWLRERYAEHVPATSLLALVE